MVHSSIGVGYLTVSQKRGVQLPYEPPTRRFIGAPYMDLRVNYHRHLNLAQALWNVDT